MHLICKRRAAALLAAAVLTVTLSVGTYAAESRADIFNEAELSAVSPSSQALDDYLDELMPTLIDDDMEPYEQLRACYDYLVDNVRYGSHMGNLGATINGVSCNSIYSSYGAVEGFGAVALSAKVGMCNAYASAFILMARKIGYDAYLVEGSTKAGGGGYAYHEWAEIDIDDAVYVFDPQLEQDLVGAGLGEYAVFGKTYEQIPGRYIKY